MVGGVNFELQDMIPDFDVSRFRFRCVSALRPIHLIKHLRRIGLSQTTTKQPFKTKN